MEIKEIEEKKKYLEDFLKKEGTVTLWDRLKGLSKETFVALGLSFGFLVGSGYLFMNGFNKRNLVQDYNSAYDYVITTRDCFSKLSEGGVKISFSPEVLEVPMEMVERGSDKIYRSSALAVLEDMKANCYKFNGSLEDAVGYLDSLKPKLEDLMKGWGTDAGFGFYSFLNCVGISFGFFLGLFFGVSGGYYFGRDTKGGSSERLSEKIDLKKKLNDMDLNGKIERLGESVHFSRVYDILEKKIKNSDYNLGEVVEYIKIFDCFQNERYGEVYNKINGGESPRELRDIFNKYGWSDKKVLVEDFLSTFGSGSNRI